MAEHGVLTDTLFLLFGSLFENRFGGTFGVEHLPVLVWLVYVIISWESIKSSLTV